MRIIIFELMLFVCIIKFIGSIESGNFFFKSLFRISVLFMCSLEIVRKDKVRYYSDSFNSINYHILPSLYSFPLLTSTNGLSITSFRIIHGGSNKWHWGPQVTYADRTACDMHFYGIVNYKIFPNIGVI